VNSQASELEICEVVWWRGYVKGRFQAYAGSGPAAELIAESPAIKWRSSAPREPTAAATAALDALTAELAETGWQVEEREAGPWFGLRLSRPAVVMEAPTAPTTPTAVRPARAPAAESNLDEALLAELRAELDDARAAARRERGRRLDAESEVLRLQESPPRRPATQPLSAWALRAAYAIAVAAAAVVGLLGFGSTYGAVVAALTTLAVMVAIDSWIVARRRQPAPS